jgi:SH3 domain-containing protein
MTRYKLALVNVSRRLVVFAATLVVLTATQAAADERRAVIEDPDGFTNVRAEPDAKGAVVAKVKRGEVFTFDMPDRGSEWCHVTLASGTKGYLHASRVRLHSTMAELADTKPTDEVVEYARRDGIDYFPLARAAARGEPKAMRTYFTFQGDGAAAETHAVKMVAVIHILGDEKLAAFLQQQPADYRKEVRAAVRLILDTDMIGAPMDGIAYLRRHFPKTVAALKL